MSVAAMLEESTHENVISVGRPPLAANDPGPPPGAILALDLGQTTGWAVRTLDGVITSGTAEFKPGRFQSVGMVYLRFRAWLEEIRETSGGVGAVWFEEVAAHRGVAASHAYGGFLAHLTAWAEARQIPYAGVPVGTIKRHITGRGNAEDRGDRRGPGARLRPGGRPALERPEAPGLDRRAAGYAALLVEVT